jgi:predicted metal-dependent enzyme (double-stranded beta helix superfamily)
MAYTLEQFVADCRAALRQDNSPGGREQVRGYVERACADEGFLAANIRPDQEQERHLLYEDPDLGFCILSHVYTGAKHSPPHDHGSSWAIYGQTYGVTDMSDWRVLQRPANGQPGKVAKVRDYRLTPGVAHVYNEGDVHSPSRTGATRLIRIEGVNLLGKKRDKYEVVDA